MSYKIVTDSSCNLPEHLIEEFDLEILSLMFRIGEEEFYSYQKGKITDLKQFYDRMRNKETITTSHINPEVCQEAFEGILQQGEDLLYIGFSSALSGTFQTANFTLEELKEKYPERKIYSVDTLGASLGEGLLVFYAAQMRKSGQSIDEVYAWLMENRLHLCHWFTVEDLFFLKRGGRISGATALLGTLLGMKPVMHMDNEGRLVAVGKVRGRRNSLNALLDHMAETAMKPESQAVFISHGDCLEDAQYVEQQVKERFNVKSTLIHYVDPVIGAHSGPGTIALFFLGSER